MSRIFRASLALALLSAACHPEEQPPEPTPAVDPCTTYPALTLSASPTRVHVSDPVDLKATGGSGYYRFRAESGGSSGEMRGSRFIAGPTPSKDTLVVEDLRCPGAAQTQVEVVTGFDVAPVHATVKPGTAFQVQVSGQLGDPVFTLVSSTAGSTLSPSGQYTAGTGQGTDLVRVRDSRTGEEALLEFEVSADAQLRGDPAYLAVPSGSSLPLGTVGGSDRVTWTKVSGPGSVSGGRFSAAAGESGTAVLEAADPFTQQTARVSVRVLDELKRDTQAHGQLTDTSSVVTADFDGDGILDVAVGRPESDLARPSGGVVLIFKGSVAGLPSTPTWTLAGDTDTARFGDFLVAGDLDKDGKAELAVSSPGADVTIGDSGAVYLYHFGASGPELMRAPLAGVGRGTFGAGLALADADGDGDLDLIVGSPTGDLAASTTVSRRGTVDIYQLTPGQPVPELPAIRLGGSDLGKTGVVESRTGTELGRFLVMADLNGDGMLDIAALNKVSRFNTDGTSAGVVAQAVAVFFARADGIRFRANPDVYVLPSTSTDSNEGTWKLDAIPGDGTRPPLLLVVSDRADSPDLRASGGLGAMSDAGGALLYDLSAFKPTGEPSDTPAQVKRDDAYARLYGDVAGIVAGRSWAVMDVDGNPGPELLLGAPYASVTVGSTSLRMSGKVNVYPLATLSRGTVLNKPSSILGGPTKSDVFGTGLAAWQLPGNPALVVFSARASADGLNFTGRVDAFLKAGTALSQWSRTSAMVPARPSLERFGEVVAVGKGTTGAVALVGAPGYAGPGPNADGNDLSAGRAWTYSAGTATLAAEGASAPLSRGRNVGTDVAFTDFNGDGRPDVVMGAPSFTMPGANVRSTEITPVYAQERTECVPTSSLTAGGLLVSLAQADGSYKPAYRLWAPGDIAGCTPAGTATCQRRSMGRGVVGGFDFNGDGKQDIGMLRNNGFDVLLGRAPDDATLAKLTMGCDPVYTAPYSSQQTSAPASLGDLDGDGCDDVSWRYSDGSSRSGIVILFGYDASGVKCGGHTVPARVRIAADPEVGINFMGLGVATTRAGRVLGKSGADYVAVSASGYIYNDVTQPAVLLFNTAEIVKRRPASGETLVGALDTGMIPQVVVHRTRAVNFGTALAGNVDVTGDGVPDLVVGAPGASVASDGGGAVFIYAGGPSSTGALSPFLTLTGDVKERSNFGAELALMPGFVLPGNAAVPATLVVGAPLSYRTGTQNGTAYLVPLGF